ncbi:DUF6188 family protein [Brachybacterium sp. p3-SID1565]|uniref:DUF6188 family protein n=1 Tax=Brachybacterium sp. p3-SID1565 TaxID=2916046 RepID=UPI0021A7D3C3|nr:DUF6188 family protein [Brachybacterium sp. p3-SID1565]MCT1386632.1 DUF6188 family protein [Brachybacterium sp. p3-SID1565]
MTASPNLFTLEGGVVSCVEYDFPRFILATEDGWNLTIESDLTFCADGAVLHTLDEATDHDIAIPDRLRAGIRCPITGFVIGDDDSLHFELAGCTVCVAQDPDYEAWSFIGPGHMLAMARTGSRAVPTTH